MESFLSRIMFPNGICRAPKLLFLFTAMRQGGFMLAIFVTLVICKVTQGSIDIFLVLDIIFVLLGIQKVRLFYSGEKEMFLQTFFYVSAKMNDDAKQENAGTTKALNDPAVTREIITTQLYRKASEEVEQARENGRGIVYTILLFITVVLIFNAVISKIML